MKSFLLLNLGASAQNRDLENVDLTMALSYDREETFNIFPSQLSKQTVVHNWYIGFSPYRGSMDCIVVNKHFRSNMSV